MCILGGHEHVDVFHSINFEAMQRHRGASEYPPIVLGRRHRTGKNVQGCAEVIGLIAAVPRQHMGSVLLQSLFVTLLRQRLRLECLPAQ
jgi:hypothetical protein